MQGGMPGGASNRCLSELPKPCVTGSNFARSEPTQLTELDVFLLVQDVCVVVESLLGLEPPQLARMSLHPVW